MSDFLTLLAVVCVLWTALLIWPGGARRVAAWWRYADRGDGTSNGAGGDAIAALVFMTVLVVIIALVMASKWLYDLIYAI